LATREETVSGSEYRDFLYSFFCRVPNIEFPVKQGIIREFFCLFGAKDSEV
jgi:hypothetical protein